jgi:bacteriocin biosynthesis cyclodehydratase domain-containing protein
VTTDPFSDSTRHLLILAAGDFGTDVADRLAPHYRTTVQDVGAGTHASLWPHADLILLATTCERPRIAEAVDETAYVRGIPWLPVHTRPTDLQCGPVVIPGRTACHRCFVRRRRQHGGAPVAEAGRRAPSGYARHHVGIAAGLARQAVAEAFEGPDPDSLGGTVRLFNLVSGTTTKACVTAVDGCRRCRGRFGSLEQSRQALWRELDEVAAQVRAARRPPLHEVVT